MAKEWRIHNPSGKHRVIVTKELPGVKWLDILVKTDCRVEVCTATHVLSLEEIKDSIGNLCHAAIGQLTEVWDDELFTALKNAGGMAYSNYAVGFNNVDIQAATRHGIPVGNTPGVLTETTAEMAVALTFAAARRTGEAERFLRAGQFKGWMPTLFMGELLYQKTVGIIGAGRIGSTYARMMMEVQKMNVIYYDIVPNTDLEKYCAAYSEFIQGNGQVPVHCQRTDSVEEVLRKADCVSIHTVLDPTTHHLINAKRLALMKDHAILVNTSRGPVIDEAALVDHCRNYPDFRAGLDVFEDEPNLKPGLAELDNMVIVPHIASATSWTRQGMATLAASNVTAILKSYPVWNRADILAFVDGQPPKTAPSILNAKELGLPLLDQS